MIDSQLHNWRWIRNSTWLHTDKLVHRFLYQAQANEIMPIMQHDLKHIGNQNHEAKCQHNRGYIVDHATFAKMLPHHLLCAIADQLDLPLGWAYPLQFSSAVIIAIDTMVLKYNYIIVKCTMLMQSLKLEKLYMNSSNQLFMGIILNIMGHLFEQCSKA